MRLFAILIIMNLPLMGCVPASHKTTPRPLSRKATFAIYVVSTTNSADTETATDPEGGGEIYLTAPAVITSADVVSVDLSQDSPNDPSLSINLILTPIGASKLSAITAAQRGSRLAIVVNEKVVMAPKINSTLSNQVRLSGNKSKEIFDSLTDTAAGTAP